MGNCQAAEAATVVIQHPGPGGRVERVYWSLTASQVMAANPGHYVAAIISSTSAPPPHRDNSSSFSTSCTTSTATATATAASTTVKHLKLLRPDDTLHIGHVYRLVSFEEVLREFATKKHVKLSRLIHAHKERGRGSRRATGRSGDGEHRGGGGRAATPESSPAATVEAEAEEEEVQWIGSGISRRGRGGGGGAAARQGQWRPALQSISEVVGS